MQFWKKSYKEDDFDLGEGEHLLLKHDGENNTDRIIALTKKDNNIIFTEMCDEHFSQKFTKEDAIKVLQEAIDWVKSL